MKALLLWLSLLLACAGHAFALNFVVDRNDDANVGACTAAPNDCTLRGAINSANVLAGADTISFAIGSGVQSIAVGAGGLPAISDPVTIDGTTQPGFTNTPLIELNGNGADISGLHFSAASSTVRALVINRFGRNGIRLTGGGNRIHGCFIGTDVTGTAALGNGTGVAIDNASGNLVGSVFAGTGNVISGNNGVGVDISGPSASANVVQGNLIGTDLTGTAALGNGGVGVFDAGRDDTTIGGTVAGARNVISGNGGDGVHILRDGFGSGGNTMVQGNFIGTDVTGTVRLGNAGAGVSVNAADNNTIGGTTAAARNLISGNVLAGVVLSSSNGNLVQGNFIGTDVNGTADLGNLGNGVRISGDNNGVGGSVAGAGNTIAYNDLSGVAVLTSFTGNQIFANSIHSNVGLGIDLFPLGVTPNDERDADSGANNLQNFPVVESAVSSGGTTTIQGRLNSVPNGSFFIDLYSSAEADPTGFGEGQNYLGAVRVTSDERSAIFSFTASGDLAGRFITATATNVSSNDTSEFSAAVLATGGATPTPTSTPTPTPSPSATPTPSPTPTPAARPLNISTRLRVQTGDNVLIGGFIIRGDVPKRIIVRALGPSLSGSGVANPLADPMVELRGPGGELLAQNDNWRDTQEAQIQASGLAPENNAEGAIIATLPPEGYTVIVRGKNESSGVALVEGYDLESGTSSEFANISTRGFVETGEGVMIGGFILGGSAGATQVALRGLGPSLANAGLSNVLADPTLDLRDANATRIGFNDDWMDNPAQAVQLTANGLAPQNGRESGIFATLAPGLYTVILAGKDGGTGVGLVEIYKVEN